jgi:phage replication O-like protein O
VSDETENGYTQTNNKILDAFAKIRIPGEARQVLDFIQRKTVGWHKEKDILSLSQFVDGTGLGKTAVCRAITKLITMNLIIIEKDNADNVSYCFNRHYTKWKPLSKKITLSKKIISVIEKDNLPLSKKGNTKETIYKETITKDITTSFEQFWKEYPRKTAKSVCLKKWLAIHPNAELSKTIIDAVVKQVSANMLNVVELQFCPHPITWLNQKRWEDPIVTIKGVNSGIKEEITHQHNWHFTGYFYECTIEECGEKTYIKPDGYKDCNENDTL